MGYFVMRCHGEYPSAALDEGPDLDEVPWHDGSKLDYPVPEPLRYTLDPTRPGNIKVMYTGTAFPIMRDDLVDALQAAGVDNLQLFRAIVHDPATGAEHKNYKAFNIVGAVSAADMAKSVLMGTSEDSTMIDVDFESLAIDEKKAGQFHMFRLAESVSAIVVDEAVKNEIERRNIPGMEFYEPEDWSG